MRYKVKLRIADITIKMQSRFPLEQFAKEEQRLQVAERFKNFFYNGRQKPDILINVEIVNKLPSIHRSKPLFITRHFQDGKENWRLLKKGDTYTYKSPLEDKKQLMLVNRTFDRVTAYVLPKNERSAFIPLEEVYPVRENSLTGQAEEKGGRNKTIANGDFLPEADPPLVRISPLAHPVSSLRNKLSTGVRENSLAAFTGGKPEFIKENERFAWSTSDIIYDFLQVLLINYFAQRNEGIFTHAIGVRDLNEQGLVFVGKSGCGKTTTARLWHKHSRAMVLNDDRIIVRKIKGKFFIYGSPWHGEFSDYLTSRIESAQLGKLFFIHRAPKNTVRFVFEKEAFNLLYPAIFPTFWDRGCLGNIVSFCQDLIRTIPCFSLGFINDKRIIGFVRKIDIDANSRKSNANRRKYVTRYT